MNWIKLNEIAALLCTGLLAGVFFIFENTINPSLHRLPDAGYLAAMQHINRIIQNPVFLLVFMSPVLLLPLSAWQHWGKPEGSVYWLLAAVLYAVAVFGITMFFNVPLNNLLEQFDLANVSPSDLRAMRERYEIPWNRWHTIRTWAAIAAFLLAVLPLVFHQSNPVQAK